MLNQNVYIFTTKITRYRILHGNQFKNVFANELDKLPTIVNRNSSNQVCLVAVAIKSVNFLYQIVEEQQGTFFTSFFENSRDCPLNYKWGQCLKHRIFK